jgi:4-amino-4-deoxy-L-arabinose transferase-like glycosyltransferase
MSSVPLSSFAALPARLPVTWALTARDLLVIVLVSGVVLFTNLGGPRLWDRDEPRNAGCAREMLERGDWITPYFNAELRTHKPVLLYWLIMSAYQLFGIHEFSARFWSAALSIGTALLTYHLGCRLSDRRVGFWAALILSTTLMFDVAGRAATPDALLIFCVTLAITCYVHGELTPATLGQSDWRRPLRLRTALTMYAAMGLAMLAKGPVGLVLPTAVIGMFLLIMRQVHEDVPGTPAATIPERLWGWLRGGLNCFAPRHFLSTCWDMRPLLALSVSLSIAAPWYLWVGLRTDGEFLRGFFFEHNVGRAMQSFEGHRGGAWFYPIAILVGFFPWSVFAAPVLLDLARRLRAPAAGDRARTGLLLAICWVGVWVTIFSIARTKLPSYVTPCYPALALITAAFLVRWIDRGSAVSERWSVAALGALIAVGVVLLVGLPIVTERYLPQDGWLGLLGLLPLAGGSVALFWRRHGRDRAASATVLGTAVAFTTMLCAVGAQRVDYYQQSDRILAAIERQAAQQVIEVGALGGLEPSWVFYGGRAIRELSVDPAQELTAAQVALQFFAAGRSSTIPAAAAGDDAFASQRNSAGDHNQVHPLRRCLITTDEQLRELQHEMPGRWDVVAAAPRFLKPGRLLLITLAENPPPL